MIVRIKKRDLAFISVSLFFTLSLIFMVSVPLIYALTTNTTERGFGVWLTISNVGPNVTMNNITIGAIDPIASSDVELLISFNVTDPQGVHDINASKAIVNVTLGGLDGQWRSNISEQSDSDSGTCFNHTENGVVIINCSVWLRYYDNASSNWAVNISVEDTQGAVGRNDTITFTYNPVSSFTLATKDISEEGLNFTSLNPGDVNKEAKAPILLNNTGNEDFEQINITGADLISDATTDTVAVSSFAINVSNSTTDGRGMALATTAQVIPAAKDEHPGDLYNPNATLLHGPGLVEEPPYMGPTLSKGNRTLIFWVDVPTGKTAATYNNTWNITVVSTE